MLDPVFAWVLGLANSVVFNDIINIKGVCHEDSKEHRKCFKNDSGYRRHGLVALRTVGLGRPRVWMGLVRACGGVSRDDGINRVLPTPCIFKKQYARWGLGMRKRKQ